MRRAISLIFLLWGVATVMVGGYYLVIGIGSPERFVGALVAGSVLLAIAWWFDRAAKRQRDQIMLNEDRGSPAAADFKPSRRSRRSR